MQGVLVYLRRGHVHVVDVNYTIDMIPSISVVMLQKGFVDVLCLFSLVS